MSQPVSDLDAYLEECQDRILVNAKETLPMLLKAPDHIDAAREVLGDSYAAYRIRVFGVLASGLLIFGSTAIAERAFRKASVDSHAIPACLSRIVSRPFSRLKSEFSNSPVFG